MRVWLGPWQWVEDAVGRSWRAPEGVTSVLDLRPLLAQATAGGPPTGSGIFITDDGVEVKGGVLIASDPQEQVSSKTRDQFAALVQQPLDATRLDDLLWEMLTRRTDPAGSRICPPLMPSTKRRLALTLGPIARDIPFAVDSQEWPLVQQVHQRQYREAMAAVDAGALPAEFHRKMLQVWIEKYRLPEREYTKFIPDDLPKTDGPIAHGTTLTESFNTADSTTLGPDQTWTEVAGDWHVASNTGAYASNTEGTARAEADVSSADHYAQITIVAMNASGNCQLGPCARFASGANTCYAVRVINPIAAGVRLIKLVSGALTDLDTQSFTVSPPNVVKLECNGSAIKSYIDTTVYNSVTDTAITTGTRGGMFAYNSLTDTTSVRADVWSLSDLAAATGNPWHYYAQQ